MLISPPCPIPAVPASMKKAWLVARRFSVVIATLPAVPVPDVWVSISATKPSSNELVVASRLPVLMLIVPPLPVPVVLAVRVGDRSFVNDVLPVILMSIAVGDPSTLTVSAEMVALSIVSCPPRMR